MTHTSQHGLSSERDIQHFFAARLRGDIKLHERTLANLILYSSISCVRTQPPHCYVYRVNNTIVQ